MNRYSVYTATQLTDDLVPLRAYALPLGFPLIVDLLTMEICEPLSLFLRATEVNQKYPQGYSGAVTGIAHDLRDFFEYLDHLELAWQDVLPAHVENYRDLLLATVSPITLRPYSIPTVNRRLYAVKSFYGWARGRGLYTYLLDAPSQRSRASTGAYSNTPSTLMAGGGPAAGDRVRPLSRSDVLAIFRALGPLPPEPGREAVDLRPVRDRLIAELSYTTGLRRDEIRHITARQVNGLASELKRQHLDDHQVLELALLRTKGQRPGSILIPVWLIRALEWYLREERREALRAFRGDGEPNQLFLNHAHSRVNPGGAVTNDTISDTFHRAVIASGLYDESRRVDPESGEVVVHVQGHHRFHDLRHTFAVIMYMCEKQQGNAEPWKFIQILLRHANVTTTMNIYLKAVHVYEAIENDRLRDHYQALRSRVQDV